MTPAQTAEYLKAQSADLVMDIVTGELDDSFKDLVIELLDDAHSLDQLRVSAASFAYKLIEKLVAEVSKFEDAREMFSTEQEDEAEHLEREDTARRARELNDENKRSWAA